MNLGMDTSTVAQNVQLALAPVFFLTAVAGMIAVVAGRLARIVDRARVVELALENASKTTEVEKNLRELRYLHLRGRLSNASIGLLTLCGFLIGLTIIFLFLGQEWGLHGQRMAIFSFLAGVVSFIAALIGFLWETVLAMQLFNSNALEVERHIQREA